MRKDDNIFIPLTLDNSTKTAWGAPQFIGLIGFTILLIVVQISALMIYDRYGSYAWYANPLILIPLDIVVSYVIIFVFRKLILKEDDLLKAYTDSKDRTVSDIGYLWDIFSIENGRITYMNGYVAKVIEFRHGYIYDRPEKHIAIHRETIQNMLRLLMTKGYKFKYYNEEVRDTNLEPLYKTKDRLRKFENSSGYNLLMEMINFTENVCSEIASLEVETYVIIADTNKTIQNIDEIAQDMINISKNGLFSFSKILSTEEIEDMICRQCGITTLNSSEILSRKFKNNTLNLVTPLEVITEDGLYTFDEYTNMYTYEYEDAYEDGTEYTDTNSSYSDEEIPYYLKQSFNQTEEEVSENDEDIYL